jgi:uracil-DNA glycosylase family 4
MSIRARDVGLAALEADVTRCRRCPRLVQWREEVAREKRAAFKDDTYWGRPIPGFGDPAARVLILGLAPAAHGANRTGRVFTGDRSGDFLFASLHRTGFASQPTSVSRDDGLQLTGAWITAAVRCAPPANKPTPDERDNCLPWTVAELDHINNVRVVVCLGQFAWDAALRLRTALGHPPVRPKPKFGHGTLWYDNAPGAAGDGARSWALLGTYHPSQQNTFTGVLTEPMLDDVFRTAKEIAGA